jgi:hypothetical protein
LNLLHENTIHSYIVIHYQEIFFILNFPFVTEAESKAWYSTFKKFSVSRITTWKPKVYQNLLQMIRNATDEPSVQIAINHLDENMMKPSGIAQTLTAIYTDAGRVFGAHTYQMVKKQGAKIEAQVQKHMMPIGYNEDLVAEIIAYYRLHLLNKAVLPITDTMKAWILDQLEQAQQTGMSISQVADAMIAHDFPVNRSFIIARTETVKAANFGAVQGAKKTGLLTEKQWIAAQDSRTRRIPRDEFSHLAMHGVRVPMDKPFLVPNRNGSHDSLMQPGDPAGQGGDVIQCRCTVGFKVVRDERGLPVRISD